MGIKSIGVRVRRRIRSKRLKHQLHLADELGGQLLEEMQRLQAALILADSPSLPDHANCPGLSSWGSTCSCRNLAGRRLIKTQRNVESQMIQLLGPDGRTRRKQLLQQLARLDSRDSRQLDRARSRAA